MSQCSVVHVTIGCPTSSRLVVETLSCVLLFDVTNDFLRMALRRKPLEQMRPPA